MCRLCKQKTESIDYFESRRSILTYKERHDKIGHYIHWKICKYNGILDYEKKLQFFGIFQSKLIEDKE